MERSLRHGGVRVRAALKQTGSTVWAPLSSLTPTPHTQLRAPLAAVLWGSLRRRGGEGHCCHWGGCKSPPSSSLAEESVFVFVFHKNVWKMFAAASPSLGVGDITAGRQKGARGS